MPRWYVEHIKALFTELHQIMDDPQRFILVLQNLIDRLLSVLVSMSVAQAKFKNDSTRYVNDRSALSSRCGLEGGAATRHRNR